MELAGSEEAVVLVGTDTDLLVMLFISTALVYAYNTLGYHIYRSPYY